LAKKEETGKKDRTNCTLRGFAITPYQILLTRRRGMGQEGKLILTENFGGET
jgi:hypothetical protein